MPRGRKSKSNSILPPNMLFNFVLPKIKIIQRKTEIFVGFVKNKRRDKKERFWFLFCDEKKAKTWRGGRSHLTLLYKLKLATLRMTVLPTVKIKRQG